jgi:hypothetical protein
VVLVQQQQSSRLQQQQQHNSNHDSGLFVLQPLVLLPQPLQTGTMTCPNLWVPQSSSARWQHQLLLLTSHRLLMPGRGPYLQLKR